MTMLRAQSLWLDAVDHASTKEWRSRSAAAGHHASRHVADGFCLYNFAAGAAAYALDVLDKDWVAGSTSTSTTATASRPTPTRKRQPRVGAPGAWLNAG